MNISQETLRFDQNATGAWRLAATGRGARAHSYQCHGRDGYSGSHVSSCVAWARGGEGAVAELPRATGSRPNSSRFKFSFFSDLRQPQVGQSNHLRQFTIRCDLPDKHTVLSVCVSVRDFKCLDGLVCSDRLPSVLRVCVYVFALVQVASMPTWWDASLHGMRTKSQCFRSLLFRVPWRLCNW